MKMITAIKNEFRRIKDMSAVHLIFAVLACLAVSVIAVTKAPLDPEMLSPFNWIMLCFEPAATTFLFFSMIQKPKRSVLWFAKYIYYIASVLTPLLLMGVIFDPNKEDLYSEHFTTKFLPWWACLWWLGMILAYVIMRLAGHAVHKGYAKGSFAARLIYALAAMYTPQKTINASKRDGKGKWVCASVCMLLVGVAVFLATVSVYLYCVYTNMEFEAILFTMTFAAGGLAIEDIIAGTAIFLIFAGITLYFCLQLLKCFKNNELVVKDTGKDGKYTLVMNGKKRAFSFVLSGVMLIGGTAMFSAQTNFIHYVDVKSGKSSIYDDYYVKPDESMLTFPEKKRNLIYIYLESIETTYASKEAGGSQEKNYISELTELAKDKNCVNFSNTDLLGGASVFVPSITYTMGSTVAQTCGIAMNTKILPGNQAQTYPSVIRLEDILHDNGYNQLYIEGSKGEFSLYDKYVGRYEDSKVFDRKTASDQGYTDEKEDYIWKWGIEDRKLIEITKELITDISKEDKPFFVTMYTMDTHTFESGHRCPECDSKIKNDYLASVDCTSRRINEFVNWVKQQPFYENTTIVLVGDHLGNEKTTQVDIDKEYVRTTYNCIINPAKQAANPKERLFSSLDMFPTTLSAIGVQIKGDRLGLGTDLFSETRTLCEELGEKEYKKQLEQTSDYYDTVFYGS